MYCYQLGSGHDQSIVQYICDTYNRFNILPGYTVYVNGKWRKLLYMVVQHRSGRRLECYVRFPGNG